MFFFKLFWFEPKSGAYIGVNHNKLFELFFSSKESKKLEFTVITCLSFMIDLTIFLYIYLYER